MSNGMDNGYRTISQVIILATLVTIFGLFAGAIAMAALGIIGLNASISADVNIVGTIPIDMVFYGIGGLLVWMIYIAFMDIYDSEDVKEAKDDAVDLVEDNSENDGEE